MNNKSRLPTLEVTNSNKDPEPSLKEIGGNPSTDFCTSAFNYLVYDKKKLGAYKPILGLNCFSAVEFCMYS